MNITRDSGTYPISVNLLVIEEAMESGCCREGLMDGEGLLGLCNTTDGSSFVQVLGTNVVVLQIQLASGETKSTAGAGKVGRTGEYFEEGGSG